MFDLATVLVIAIRPLLTDDGAHHEVIVLDRSTGDVGSLTMTDLHLRDLLGDCPTSDLIDVDPRQIMWRR
jgi:hypothetical protein